VWAGAEKDTPTSAPDTLDAATREGVLPHIGRSVTATAVIATTACALSRGATGLHPVDAFVLAGSPTADWAETDAATLRTRSSALDRITKREPRLDSTMRRFGTGRGVAIYVFDGGVSETHAELAGRVRVGFDAFPSSPRVCNPHGTAVAGAAAGATLGVAPDAEIVDVKIINCDHMRGSVTAIVEAARWTVQDHHHHPGQPAVANWSFAVDTTHGVPQVDSALAMLRDAGILVIVAAGNFDMDACHISPANAPRALVVGASALIQSAGDLRWRDVRAKNTAWGPCVDLYAPGDSVLLPGFDREGPTTSVWNGTSMAAGYVSGAASLLMERDPHASADDVMLTLLQQATPSVVDERAGTASAATPSRSPLLYVGPAVRTVAALPYVRY
jgi:subtilisin family serine protease